MMSYDLFQSLLVFAIVVYCFVQLLRKLMPQSMRKLQAHIAFALGSKALQPAPTLAKSGGCSDCSTCGACSSIGKSAPSA